MKRLCVVTAAHLPCADARHWRAAGLSQQQVRNAKYEMTYHDLLDQFAKRASQLSSQSQQGCRVRQENIRKNHAVKRGCRGAHG